MTSLYDQYHSDKNLNHIYNLINDLIEKNHNNNILNDEKFKNYYMNQCRDIFINSKSDNLVDLNRETIKHHLLYYRNTSIKYKNTQIKPKSTPIETKPIKTRTIETKTTSLKINDDVSKSFDEYLKNRDLPQMIPNTPDAPRQIKNKVVNFNDTPNVENIDNDISFDDMMNDTKVSTIEKPNITQTIEKVNIETPKNYITLTSANRTGIMSNRFDYNIKCEKNIKHLEKLIIPIENTLHFALPMLKFKIPEMNIDTNLYLQKTYDLNNYSYGIYIPNDDLVLNKINDNINIQICSIYGNDDTKIKNDIIECEFVEDKLKPKNIDDFKVNDIISINSKHFTKIIDIVDDSLILEKLPSLESEESIYIMNMNLQNTLVFY
jgi:hypothetical protein